MVGQVSRQVDMWMGEGMIDGFLCWRRSWCWSWSWVWVELECWDGVVLVLRVDDGR